MSGSKLPADFPFFRHGEVVQHKGSGRVGKVTGFVGVDIMVDETGPYPQADFDRMVKEQKDQRPSGETVDTPA